MSVRQRDSTILAALALATLFAGTALSAPAQAQYLPPLPLPVPVGGGAPTAPPSGPIPTVPLPPAPVLEVGQRNPAELRLAMSLKKPDQFLRLRERDRMQNDRVNHRE
ncbi:MAG: hypothetical protein ABR562_06435, partial [Thermoplasmatota archaeon]